jgi:hypothetical protein
MHIEADHTVFAITRHAIPIYKSVQLGKSSGDAKAIEIYSRPHQRRHGLVEQPEGEVAFFLILHCDLQNLAFLGTRKRLN